MRSSGDGDWLPKGFCASLWSWSERPWLAKGATGQTWAAPGRPEGLELIGHLRGQETAIRQVPGECVFQNNRQRLQKAVICGDKVRDASESQKPLIHGVECQRAALAHPKAPTSLTSAQSSRGSRATATALADKTRQRTGASGGCSQAAFPWMPSSCCAAAGRSGQGLCDDSLGEAELAGRSRRAGRMRVSSRQLDSSPARPSRHNALPHDTTGKRPWCLARTEHRLPCWLQQHDPRAAGHAQLV